MVGMIIILSLLIMKEKKESLKAVGKVDVEEDIEHDWFSTRKRKYWITLFIGFYTMIIIFDNTRMWSNCVSGTCGLANSK